MELLHYYRKNFSYSNKVPLNLLLRNRECAYCFARAYFFTIRSSDSLFLVLLACEVVKDRSGYKRDYQRLFSKKRNYIFRSLI